MLCNYILDYCIVIIDCINGCLFADLFDSIALCVASLFVCLFGCLFVRMFDTHRERQCVVVLLSCECLFACMMMWL